MQTSSSMQPTNSPMWHPSLNGVVSRFETRFRSTRPTEAEAYLSQLWGANWGTELAFDAGMTVDRQGFEFAGLQVGTTHFGAGASVKSTPIADDPGTHWFFLCNMSASSHNRLGKLALDPGEAATLRLNDFAQTQFTANYRPRSLAIADADLLAAHRALHGTRASPDIGFERKMPAGSAATASLLRVIERLATTPKYPQQHAVQLERALKESALFELLLAWPGAHPVRQGDGAALPASTRLARDFIHAHIAELPTVSDVAAHCRVGVRALDRGFRKHLGISPWQYMLELRLRGVRDDLKACRHGGTVTGVALHWGFSNLGTFSARYREQFGELPSESLRMARLHGTAPRPAPAGTNGLRRHEPAGQFRFETLRLVAGSQSA